MMNKAIQHLLRRITVLLLHNRFLNSASSLWNKLWRFILGHIIRRPFGRLGFGQIPPQTRPRGDSSRIALGLKIVSRTHDNLGSDSPSIDNGDIGPATGILANEPLSDATLAEDPTPKTITNLSLTSESEISAFIYPLMPSKLSRYERQWVVDPRETPVHKLKAMQLDFSDGELPPGWEQYIHPDGAPFFWQGERRIVTDSWIYDHEIFRVLTEFIAQIDDFIRSRNLEWSDGVDLVLEVVNAEGVWWCGYYFAHHSNRLLYWLESYKVNDFLEEVKGNLSPSHIKLMLQSQYWSHWALFPNITRATLEVMNLMTDAIRDAQTGIAHRSDYDYSYIDESTTNLTLEELKNMIEVVNDAKGAMDRGEGCSTWFVGRFMGNFWCDRFLNFYGQRSARLARSQSIHGRPPHNKPTSYLFKILSPLLFCAPDVHLRNIENIWVDKVVGFHSWEEFFNKLNKEWKGHITYASILLNANVAFLAIPSNDPIIGLGGSPVEIASYLSIITSIASMMLGLLLNRRHQTRERSTNEQVRQTVRKINRRTHGVETLSIMYGLPYALLMWSVVTFLAAFSIMCFQNTNKLACYIVGAAWVLNAVLVAWCIHTSWEETENRWWSLYKGIWRWFVEGAHTLVPARSEASNNHESESDDDEPSMVGSTRSATRIKLSVRRWLGRAKPQSSPNTV